MTGEGDILVGLPRPGRYLRSLAAGALALWVAMGAWTLLVDPYGLFRLVEAKGFNQSKSDSYRIDQVLEYLERRPALVLFGSSRIGAFRDPLRARAGDSAMAYALPALKAIELLPLLEFLEDQAPPRQVLLALDFFAFNAATTVPPPRYARLDRLFWADFLFRNVLSWDVFREGIRVLARNLDQGALSAEALADEQQETLRQGTAPDTLVRRTFVKAVAAYLDRGYYGGYRFDAASADRLEALLGRMAATGTEGGVFINPPHVALLATPADRLEALLGRMAAAGTEVRLFINPPHVALLATIRVGGYWAAYETFQRRLVALAEAQGFALWDFSGVSPLSTEPVTGGMRWYTDPSHFKPAYARLMLARLAGEATDPPVGVRLASDMLEAHLAAKRAALDAYLAGHPELVRLVLDGFAQAGVVPVAAPGP